MIQRLIWMDDRVSGMMIPKYLTVLSLDGAGVIDAVGADVRDIKVGDEVASYHIECDDRAAA